MLAKFNAQNFSDSNGNPSGGMAVSKGIMVEWQNGPLGRSEDGTRIEPNGAFVETVIAIAKQRIEYYNNTKFQCRENSMAITKLDEALMWLNKRTADREARQVEGTHKV